MEWALASVTAPVEERLAALLARLDEPRVERPWWERPVEPCERYELPEFAGEPRVYCGTHSQPLAECGVREG